MVERPETSIDPTRQRDAVSTATPSATRSNRQLATWVRDARLRSLALIEDLDDEQLRGERLPTVNPLLWELGHVAWFAERFVLRTGEQSCRHPRGDQLWDSIAIAHAVRWDLDVPPRAESLAYVRAVHDDVLALLAGPELDRELRDRVLLAIFHEDMHGEAFTYTRQTFGHPHPRFAGVDVAPPPVTDRADGDVEVPGGVYERGARHDTERCVLDNERWAHAVTVAPFAISRVAVTDGQLLAFVEDDGYRRDELWTPEGLAWRRAAGADAPLYWRRAGAGAWERRTFDAWAPIQPDRAAIHVNAHEAEAWCRWAGRRLPTEVEWEVAAIGGPAAGGLARRPRRGARLPVERPPHVAHLDGRCAGPVSVHAASAGDSAFGCRQVLGNVWEWTATTFAPYPGFVPGPYKDYSAPLFGSTRVLRGGGWATRSRLVHGGWRNYYGPDRRDVFAGFRTCMP